MKIRGSRQETGQTTDLSTMVTNQVIAIGDKLFEVGGALVAAFVGAPPKIDVLEYQRVVDFFVTNRGAVPGAAAGALVRERTAGGDTVVHLVFLDSAGKPISTGNHASSGRRYLVNSFDEELTELFGNSNLIVFN